MFFYGHYIRKTVAGSLLIVLLFIHSVKLLHNHCSRQLDCKQITGHTDSVSASSVSSDCDICNYQVAKDTEHAFAEMDIKIARADTIFNAGLIVNGESSFITSFDTRGPPAFV